MVFRVEAPIKLRIKRSGLDSDRFIEITSAYEELGLASRSMEVLKTFVNKYESVDEFQ
jgi:hypothetical protein